MIGIKTSLYLKKTSKSKYCYIIANFIAQVIDFHKYFYICNKAK